MIKVLFIGLIVAGCASNQSIIKRDSSGHVKTVEPTRSPAFSPEICIDSFEGLICYDGSFCYKEDSQGRSYLDCDPYRKNFPPNWTPAR